MNAMEQCDREGFSSSLILIIEVHHNWASVVSRGWAQVASCRLHVSLLCAVFYRIVSLRYLFRLSLHRLDCLLCRILLSYGRQVLTREVRPSLRRLNTIAVIPMTCVLSQYIDVGPSYIICDVEITS